MKRETGEAQGWSWFETGSDRDIETDRLHDLFAATFATAPGRAVLLHLHRMFVDRRVPPSASDAEPRHAEGGRAAIAHIERLARPVPAPKSGERPNSENSRD